MAITNGVQDQILVAADEPSPEAMEGCLPDPVFHRGRALDVQYIVTVTV